MARITVEDCLDNVENRFQLVLVAARRARQIALGSETLVPMDNDKPTVVALREIAEGLVTNKILDEPAFHQPELGFDFTSAPLAEHDVFRFDADSDSDSDDNEDDASGTDEASDSDATAATDAHDSASEEDHDR